MCERVIEQTNKQTNKRARAISFIECARVCAYAHGEWSNGQGDKAPNRSNLESKKAIKASGWISACTRTALRYAQSATSKIDRIWFEVHTKCIWLGHDCKLCNWKAISLIQFELFPAPKAKDIHTFSNTYKCHIVYLFAFYFSPSSEISNWAIGMSVSIRNGKRKSFKMAENVVRIFYWSRWHKDRNG